MGHAIAGTFTAAVVVAPQQVDTRMLKHVEQSLAMVSQVGIVFAARHAGEHAGNGNRGFGTTRGGLREVNHVLPFQLRVGFAFVTVQGVVCRARGFADDKHQNGFLLLAGNQ